MSICRWDHKSDVYIYQPSDCGEETFIIHVRGMTATGDSQDIPTLEDMLDDAWVTGVCPMVVRRRWKELQKEVKWKPLESVYAESPDTTTTWSVDSVEELVDLLFLMQKDGVRVPPQAFVAVAAMLCEKE